MMQFSPNLQFFFWMSSLSIHCVQIYILRNILALATLNVFLEFHFHFFRLRHFNQKILSVEFDITLMLCNLIHLIKFNFAKYVEQIILDTLLTFVFYLLSFLILLNFILFCIIPESNIIRVTVKCHSWSNKIYSNCIINEGTCQCAYE